MMLIAIHAYRITVMAAAAVHFAGTDQGWITWLAMPLGLVAAYDLLRALLPAPRI